MFWDRVAGVYDLFVNVINRKAHQRLKEIVSDLIGSEDAVLECACGTGLLDNPLTALGELNRVRKDGGMLIIPTYMNKDSEGKTSRFAGAVGKAGADFKRQLTAAELWEKNRLHI